MSGVAAVVTHGNLFSQLNDLVAGVQNNASQAVKTATHIVYSDAKNTPLFKDRTGFLRESIQESVDGLKGKVVRTRKLYATYLANGTVAHIIEARKPGGMLAFRVDGVLVFRRRVRHPGTRARPFMQHAYDIGVRVLPQLTERYVDAAIRQFNK